MSRNSSGAYSLPESPFVPNTPISSTAVNSDFDDIASALTDSLSRTGEGGMQAVLQLTSGGFTYQGDSNTGISRSAADTQVITCGGTDVIEVTTVGASVAGLLESTTSNAGQVNQQGSRLLPIGLGPLPWSGETAPGLWVMANGQSLLRASYPDLWSFASAQIALGNTLYTNGNGSTTFTVPDMRGRVPAGKDDGAGRLTSTTMTPNGNSLGSVGGAQTVTLAANQIPAGVPSSGSNSISVASTVSDILRATVHDNFTSVAGDNGPIHSVTGNQITSTNPSQAIAVTSTNASQQAIDKIQPSIIVNYIIFAGV